MANVRSEAAKDRRFPPDFVFGVGTSDHQCEAYDPAHEDIRDIWERATGRTQRGRATDFWNRYPEDVDLARGLGCQAFRFSVSWTRVEPETGRYDDAAIEHYRALARRIESLGMRPIVTLHHFTWPPHLEAQGGMLGESFPDHFAAYAAVVARALGPHVAWWITFNEPTFLPLGYLKLWGQRSHMMPPGLGGASSAEQIEAASTLIRNLFIAHARARTRIREEAPGAQVGVNPFVLGMPGFVQDFLDSLATRIHDPARWRRRERGHVEPPRAAPGSVDVAMGALSWTPDHERAVMLSEPYASMQPTALVRATSGLREAGDLAGRPVAVLRYTPAVSLLRALPQPPRLRFVRSLAEGFARLERGRVEALASDDLLLASIVPEPGDTWRRIPLAAHRQWYCAGVATQREDLLSELDAAIREVLPARAGHAAGASSATPPAAPAAVAVPMAEVPAGTVTPSGEPVPAGRRVVRLAGARAPSAEAASAARESGPPDPSRAIAEVRKRGELVISLRRGVPPLSRRDPLTGAWSGIEIDIGRALARRLLGDPERVRFVEMGATERMLRLHSLRSRLVDYYARWRGLFSALTNTNWWYLGMAGRLPEFLCPPECVGQLDFVGFDYYWGVPEMRWDRIRRLLDSLGQRYSRAPVYPGGLLRLLRRYRRMFPGKDLLVIENGSVEHADGVPRANYLRAHLREVQRALHAGIPVRAYVCWSLTTNREWGLPLGVDSDFGLFRIELDTDPELKRVRTPAADTYEQIIRARDAEAGARRSPAAKLMRKLLGRTHAHWSGSRHA